MHNTLSTTDFDFPGQVEKYSGKVRDTYNIAEEYLVLVSSDRISAFDHILTRQIPFKGQVLNQTSRHFLEATKDIVPNHLVSTPDPNVTIGLKCKPIPIEMVIRGYLAGHAWRVYKSGLRTLCGVTMPDGLKEGDKFPEPILTPATKSTIGHDEDISEHDIIKSGLMEDDDWARIKAYSFALFDIGTKMAAERGLILVDTKYEFGYHNDVPILIDEIHTPDSSRYYYLDGYAERQAKGEHQKQLSKEFVREWLMENGFQGLEGQVQPDMPEDFVELVSSRYIELYETITGKSFEKGDTTDLTARVNINVAKALEELGHK